METFRFRVQVAKIKVYEKENAKCEKVKEY